MTIDPNNQSVPSEPAAGPSPASDASQSLDAPSAPSEAASASSVDQPADSAAPSSGDVAQGAPASPPADGSPAEGVAVAGPAGANKEEAAGSQPEIGFPLRRRRILIGSQRDPDAYRPKPKHDWIPVQRRRMERRRERRPAQGVAEGRAAPPPTPASDIPAKEGPQPAVTAAPKGPSFSPGAQQAAPVVEQSGPPQAGSPPQASERKLEPAKVQPLSAALTAEPQAVAEPHSGVLPAEQPSHQHTEHPVALLPQEVALAQEVKPPQEATPLEATAESEVVVQPAELTETVAQVETVVETVRTGRVRPPSRRDALTPEQEAELNQALGDVPLEELLQASEGAVSQGLLEPDSRHTGKVVAIQRENVFVELGSREQGVVPLGQFAKPPEPGAMIDVIVTRFNAEECLYELMLPYASVDVGDWSELTEGMVVEARVTGFNTGGLECEVNQIRGFIPASQISLYRVEDLAQFVDQRFTCVVTEANPERRNLVLSRRAVLEREREEARRALLESLAPGQIREGVVRRLMDFGAFVDLGSGVDGLLHISQMSWARIKHPSEMFQEGQTINVRVEKVDQQTGKISLSYRDMLENPWTNVESKYPPRTAVRGKVTRLMDYGAFVELEPGVEGLVHISELSRKHVWRVSDVVAEGQEVDVLVLSVDPQARRISLSMKDLLPPESEKGKQESPSSADTPAPPKKTRKEPTKPLLGGLGRSTGGKFGLKW